MLRTLMVLLALCWTVAAQAQLPETPQFRRFGFEQGLPKSAIHLAVDRQGYLWIATLDGLARYDGVEFKLWRQAIGASDSLPDNALQVVHVDAQDRVWVASMTALSRLDGDRRGFDTFDFPDALAGCQREITSIASTPQGDLWFGNYDGELCHRDAQGRIRRHAAGAAQSEGLPAAAVMALLIDKRGRLLVGTDDGLVRLEQGRFRRMAPGMFEGTKVAGLSMEADGTIWIGSDKGLHRLSSNDLLTPAPWPMHENATHGVVVRDRRGGRWIGTMGGLYREKSGVFQLMQRDGGIGLWGPESGVLCMVQDLEGGIWFATYSQGLAYLPPDWDRFATMTSVDGLMLDNLDLRDSVADRDGGFWVATATDLYRLERDSRSLRRIISAKDLGVQWIHSLASRPDGRLWIGHATGMSLYDPVQRQARRWPSPASDELGSTISQIMELPDGQLWLSLYGGAVRGHAADGTLLVEIDPDDAGHAGWRGTTLLVRGPDDRPWWPSAQGLQRWEGGGTVNAAIEPGPAVHAFAFAGSDRVWVARFGMLESYDWDGSALKLRERIDNGDGLPAVDIDGMLVSPGGQIWLSTIRGLLLYSPGSRRLRMFGAQDGLPDPDFSFAQPRLGSHGTALAISAGGVALFDPEMRVPDPSPPPLAIESISVLRDEDKLPFDLSAPIALQPQDRDLRISARLLSYADPRSHHYRFKLEGYDPDWIVQQGNGERVFSRLDPGRYRLMVQAAGADGGWSKMQDFPIVVPPPWWRSAWALVGFALLGGAVLGSLALEYRRRLRGRQQWQLARHKHELAEQASEAKTRFLATLGHEVRTPMTGVLGMSELLLGTHLDERQRGYAQSIRRAGEHLLRLVNNALDLARVEAGRLDLEEVDFDLRELIDDVVALMAPMAESRRLQFSDEIDADIPRVLRGDPMRLRQILLNLLGNAIKFTERGDVGLRVSRLSPRGVRLEVSDTGPGLNEEQRTRLFRRFEQADGARTASRYGGSGLGLAICQELAAAMGGRIDVDSTPGVGSRFVVDLPLAEGDAAALASAPVAATVTTAPASLRILLVEDDPTVAEVVGGLLRTRGHHVIHAAHGLAALTEAAMAPYDVALLDLDLPGMDGLALARQLRAQRFTAPLIAVTARSDADAEQQTQDAGFDGFVRKPVTGAMLDEAIEAVLPEASLRRAQ
ncbi:ligand-binding sensor domain-containing protein [Luteimonas cucumeris]|uniref:histidine kinase n=1 Tax=Luteimonas cucumeris TaxID=985012 RepID=A0A562KYA9_9GAMM|nr:hybrid sensor histidine kinase/response regulator [Luteimonas cucumeris]TWI00363.1 ligand-binding sensor domain-containing protein [Luteimonas cucumeris]